MTDPYPPEELDENDDDGTMPSNVDDLAAAIIGRRIVAVDERADLPTSANPYGYLRVGLELKLDDGRRVYLVDTNDCCAHTELLGVIKHLDQIDHMITGVGTTDGFTTWHIFADLGDVLELSVGWSAGNPFYYGYGFGITVVDADPNPELQEKTP